ncbi:MAG: hypothetical protein D6804_05395, partial [Aquificota bacterium]
PIQESYRQVALERLENLCGELKSRLKSLIEEVDPEDLEFGVRLELEAPELEELWRLAVEENNYMEVVFTEVMEHHDGAYLKATFRNSLEGCYSERYVNIWSSGRVELSHALFMELEGIRVRIEKKGEGIFSVFAQSE